MIRFLRNSSQTDFLFLRKIYTYQEWQLRGQCKLCIVACRYTAILSFPRYLFRISRLFPFSLRWPFWFTLRIADCTQMYYYFKTCLSNSCDDVINWYVFHRMRLTFIKVKLHKSNRGRASGAYTTRIRNVIPKISSLHYFQTQIGTENSSLAHTLL